MNATATTLWLLFSVTLFAVAMGLAVWRLPWDEEDDDV